MKCNTVMLKLFNATLSISHSVASYKISIFLMRCHQALVCMALGGQEGNKPLPKHLTLTFSCLTYNDCQ